MSAPVFEWIQSKLHAECDHVIDHYDRERRAAARTQREATQALAAVRSRITLLEIAVLAERARADRAEAALKRAT